jgi:ATP-dependent DNA helicase RecG
MKEYCLASGIPKPNYFYEVTDFWVEFRKDVYYEEYLTYLGLNERQIKSELFTKEKGRLRIKSIKN